MTTALNKLAMMHLQKPLSALIALSTLMASPAAVLSARDAAAPPVTSAPAVRVDGPIEAAARREIDRLVRLEPRASRRRPAPSDRAEASRGGHPKLIGALIGFGAGCALGASQVGGSTDNFYNMLDEFACPAIGGIGAAVGALIGALAARGGHDDTTVDVPGRSTR